MTGKSNINISAAQRDSLQWTTSDLQKSLDTLLSYVDQEATKAIDWYWANKKWKAILSRWFRLCAVLLTAAAGLLPVLSYIAKEAKWVADGTAMTSGLWASALVGAAAAILGIDRAFGYSSGWARYVLAATEIRRKLEEFRLDWLAQAAASGANPTTEQIAGFIQRAKEFRVAVEAIVGQETKDWVTEFQSSIAQVEKDVRTQLDALKAQVDKVQEQKLATAQPGAVEVTIDNADKAKDFAVNVRLESAAGKGLKDDHMMGSKNWGCLNLEPGHYKLVVNALAADGSAVSTTNVIVLKPATVERLTIQLPFA